MKPFVAIISWLVGFVPHKVFRFGEGHVTRYTLFECKWLGSVYVHHLATQAQDRFHTHAFNALVFILWGGYSEVVKRGFALDAPRHEVTFRAPTVRYIPRMLNHKLVRSMPHTVSLLITGPYAELWTEETDAGAFRLLTRGQRELLRVER